MKRPISAIAFVILSFLLGLSASDSTLNTLVVSAEYNKNYQRFANSTIEYIFRYKEVEETSLEGAKIFVESEDATLDDPLIVVVKQKRGTLSWQIPMYLENDQSNSTQYSKTSRNLCPSKYYHSMINPVEKNTEPEIYVSITISTASKASISFNLKLIPELDFYLKSGDSQNVTVNPSEPVYFGFTFDNSSSNVMVTVKSYYNEDVCMTFTIEPTLCPVFDYQGNTHFTGLWQTVTSKGAITVSDQDYPYGFFIVLMVNPKVRACSEDDVEIYREKNVILSISDAMAKKDYIFPMLVPLLAFIGFFVVYVSCALCCKLHRPPSLLESLVEQNTEAHISSNETENEDAIHSIDDSKHLQSSEDAIHSVDNSNHQQASVNVDLEMSLENKITCVSDLLKKEIKILRKNSHLYVYYLLIIGTFYAVPVMQLVVNYVKMLHVTGNQDLCYYNFLCSHPLYIFMDFNHIFSNFGYVLFGFLFIFIVYMRERNDPLFQSAIKKNPRQYGLFYAMGFGLIMEGLLSASYHVCPNHDIFHIDTSFMYIISVLCIMKIYQNRHPDVTAEAHVTFSAIAIVIILGLAGIIGDNSRHFWIFFTVIHFSFCWLLSIKIYYMKGWRSVGRKLLKTAKALRTGIRVHITHSYYPKRLCLIIVGNLINIGLAIFGNINLLGIDFHSYLLMIFMANLLIYTVYYICMKKRHGEKILLQPLVHIVLSLISWSGALYLFQAQSLSFSDTPAKARASNQTCLLWDFYDFHDIWHFLSALAMFFSFMMLLTLDDDVSTCDHKVF